MDHTAHVEGGRPVLPGERAGHQRQSSSAGAPPSTERSFLLRCLPSDDYAALHAFLQAQHRACGKGVPASAAELRPRMQLLAREACRRHTPVEQVIVLLKQEWAALSQAEDGDGSAQSTGGGERRVSSEMVSARARLLARLVRLVIEEYYGG